MQSNHDDGGARCLCASLWSNRHHGAAYYYLGMTVDLHIGLWRLMKIKAQRIRDARAFTTYIGNSILIMENSDLGGCETLETPNIFLFPSVLSLLLF